MHRGAIVRPNKGITTRPNCIGLPAGYKSSQAINGFILRKYSGLWILFVSSTVKSCEIPASKRSVWSVEAFWVLRSDTQKNPWSDWWSAPQRYGLYRLYPSHLYHELRRDKGGDFFPDKRRPSGRILSQYKDFYSGKPGGISHPCIAPRTFSDRQIWKRKSRSEDATYFLQVSSAALDREDSTESRFHWRCSPDLMRMLRLFKEYTLSENDVAERCRSKAPCRFQCCQMRNLRGM